MSSWVGETPRQWNKEIDGQVAFFLIITLATFFFFVVILGMHMREFRSPIVVRGTTVLYHSTFNYIYN